MKILLTILCAIMVLFGGGCALILFSGAGYNGMFQSVPLALIPAGIAALNVAVLAALWGLSRPSKPAFITLVVLDGLVVLAVLAAWASAGLYDSELNVLAGLTAGAFAAKGILTIAVLKDLKAPDAPATTRGEQ